MTTAAKRMLREFDACGRVGYTYGRRARVIGGLFHKGLVEVVEVDRRPSVGYSVGLYSLTPAGRAVLARLYEAQDPAVMLPFYSIIQLDAPWAQFPLDWHGQPYWRPGTRQPKYEVRR